MIAHELRQTTALMALMAPMTVAPRETLRGNVLISAVGAFNKPRRPDVQAWIRSKAHPCTPPSGRRREWISMAAASQ